jgi:hypothetical protein
MKSHYNWETLNAYVDGELSAEENAGVANAIVLDPDLARQFATLSTLKATLAAAGCSQDELYDIDLPSKEKTWLPWVAASVIAVALGSILAWLIIGNNLLLPIDGMQLAEKTHTEWLEESTSTASHNLQQITLRDLDYLHINAYVPDLSGVNLAFSGIRKISSGKSQGMHIGYQGPSGCMVSLVVLNKPMGLSDELASFERDQNLLYGWQVKQTVFYLLAFKMDPQRLAKVARVVNKLTRERLPLDPESIIALNQARSESQPCLA